MKKEIDDYYEKYGQKVYAYLISIHCRDDDIVIRPYTFSGLIIEEQS